MSETLGETLHRGWIETLVRQAQMIRDYPPGKERTREARKLLYGVMYDYALGRLSQATDSAWKRPPGCSTRSARLQGLVSSTCAPGGATSVAWPSLRPCAAAASVAR